MEVTEKAHAVLSPSGAAKWTACPGSIVLEEGLPNDSSPHARWGTAAHELAQLCLWDEIMDEAYSDPLNAESFVGRVFIVEGHEIKVDMEMADCVNTYCSYVHTYGDLAAGDKLYVEVEVPLEGITGEKGATGTSDAIWHLTNGEIVVIDLKGGAGVGVDADNNLQLGMYGLGAVDFLGVNPTRVRGNPTRVRGVIVQPRKNNISEFVWEPEELRGVYDRLNTGAKNVALARESDILNFLSPGEKQCRWCRAKATCPALRGEVVDVVTGSAAQPDDFADLDALPKVLSANITAPADLDAIALAASMRAAPLIETWLNAVRAEVDRRLMAGESVPGFKVVAGRAGSRAWSDAAAVEAAMKSARLKIDEMYDQKLISPTQAEKLLAKAKPKVWKKLEAFVSRADGKPSVAPESDPRPAYSTAAKVEDFEELPVRDELDPAAARPLFDKAKELAEINEDPLFA